MGRDISTKNPVLLTEISTHTPRVGRDGVTDIGAGDGARFQLTRPVWGATSVISVPL